MSNIPRAARAAVVVESNSPLEYREYPIHEPKAEQILLRVLNTNICGSDIHMFRGAAFPNGNLPFAYLLGHEFIGEIAALGAGIERDALGSPVEIGDRVTFSYYVGCGSCRHCTSGSEHICPNAMASIVQPADKAPHLFGGFAEYYLVRRGQKIFKLPEDAPSEICAGINCALAQILQGLGEIGIRYGENVVIQGAGGLGLYAVAVAREMGAGQIIAIDGVEERLDLARRMGADETISLAELENARDRTQKVQDLMGGGADVVVEVVGHPDAIPEGIRMLERGGRYLVMGAINPRQTFAMDPSIVIGRSLDIRGVALYRADVLKQGIEFIRRNKDRLPLGEMVNSYPLEEADMALEAAMNRATPGRVQLTFPS